MAFRERCPNATQSLKVLNEMAVNRKYALKREKGGWGKEEKKSRTKEKMISSPKWY